MYPLHGSFGEVPGYVLPSFTWLYGSHPVTQRVVINGLLVKTLDLQMKQELKEKPYD